MSKQAWTRWLREPLLHFAVLGLLLFGIFTLVNRDPVGPGHRITISRGDIEQLQLLFQRQWQRPPTPAEMRALIDGRIREEVLYREALALGLDRDDTIVRRRLAQKIEFIVSDTAVPAEPDDATLAAYYKKNNDRYREPARLSFNHLYFNTDRRGTKTMADAKAALTQLRAGKVDARQVSGIGDRFMLSDRYENRGTDEVARDFGSQFADEMEKASIGQWYGPITSGYGIHLVHISTRSESRLTPLTAIRERVAADWLIDQRQAANKHVYERLRSRYEIVIADTPDPATAKASNK